MLFILILYVIPSLCRISLTFVFSPRTPLSLHNQILSSIESDVPHDYEIRTFNASHDQIPDLNSDFLINFSSCIKITQSLREMVHRLDLILLEPSLPSGSYIRSEHVYYTHPPLADHSRALFLLLDWLNWDAFFTVFSTSSSSRNLAFSLFDHLKFKYPFYEHFQDFPNEAPQSHLDRYVAKDVKPTTKWKFVALNEAEGAQKTLQAAKNSRIYKEGCAFVLGSLGYLGNYDLGAILLTEQGLELAKNQGEYEVKAILKLLGKINQIRIKDSLMELFPNNSMTPEFSVMNYKTNSILEQVGSISKDVVSMTGSIVYPGNVTEIPTSKPIIPFSIETSIYNFDGSSSYESYYLNSGTKVMINLLNNDPDFLGNFNFQLHETDCGSIFNYDYFYECYSRHRPDLGCFTMLGPFYSTVLGSIQVFRDLDIRNPIIGYLTFEEELYSKEMYPEYVIPSSSLLYSISIVPNILQAMRWMNVIFFSTEGSKDLEYDLFVRRAQDMGLNILNKPQHHLFPNSYTPEQFEDFREYFQDAVDSRGSIVVIIMQIPTSVYVVQGLYDIGMRAGDVQLIMNIKLKDLIDNHDQYQYDRNKLLELGNGSLSIFNSEWVGEFGENLEPIIAEAVAPLETGYLCFPIDSFLLGAHAIEMMIRLGKDYEDPEEMNKYIRIQRFHGCSGLVSIDGSSNSRSILSYSLYNFYNNTETNLLEEKVVGNYTIGAPIPLIISKEIVWPNGLTEPMPDIKTVPKCGISPDSIRELQESKDVALYIFGGISFVCTVLALLLSYPFWFSKFAMLEEAVKMKFEDAVYMLSFAVESIQIIAISPSSEQFHPYLLLYIDLLVLDVDMGSYEYWRLLVAAMTITGIWSLCAMVDVLIEATEFLEKIQKYIELIAIRLLPYVSLWGYISLTRVLFTIYSCKKATGNRLTQAFFDQDCNVDCWADVHLVFVIVVTVILVFYIPLCTLSRLFLDQYSEYSHIKSNVGFCVFKGLTHAALAGLSALGKDEFYYSVVFWVLLAMYFVICLVLNPTNYSRMNFWIRLGNCGTILVILANVVASGLSSTISGGIQLVILAGLGLLGLLVQKKYFKSMLFRGKAIRVYDLIRFQLTRSVSSAVINRKIRDCKRNSDVLPSKYIDDAENSEEIQEIEDNNRLNLYPNFKTY